MIPKRLTLTNFLSYREVTLDFAGLHVACICGPNGAGKSSLLEAMAWVVWGHSRVATDDDVIHLGAKEVRVEFVFEHQGQVYRILRGRRRKQGCFLEFQIQTLTGFRTLTQRGVRATQQLIIQHLKVDYETFVHS
ncbi:MAG: SMC family ATPase, partial [Cyanobacteria bacterium J06607_17]